MTEGASSQPAVAVVWLFPRAALSDHALPSCCYDSLVHLGSHKTNWAPLSPVASSISADCELDSR